MAKILVIDDVSENRQVIVTVLSHFYHQLLEATDGKEGLRIAREEKPDLVIVDLLMPTMSGYEFVSRLRQEPSIAMTPVIFYSATFLEGEIWALARACGVSRVLAKPTEPGDVLRVVNEALQEGPVKIPPMPGTAHSAVDVVQVLNNKLFEKNRELLQLNARLEQTVAERTAGLAAEIEERKRAEERFRVLVETAPTGIIIVNAKGRIVDANAHTKRMFGYEQEELIGQSVETLLPEALRSVHEQHRESYGRNPHVRPMGMGVELSALRKDGTEFPVEISLGPLITHGETLTSAAIVDITTRKKMEEQLRVSQRMEAIGRLAGGVAHDFNNLLTVILGSCDALADELAADHATSRKLELAKKAASSAADLTRQLLAFGRKQILQPRIIESREIVNSVGSMLKRLVGENIDFKISVDPTAGCINADYGQIEQILVNLVTNARDSMPDGGSLEIEVANAELDETYKDTHPPVVPGSYVMIAVADTGNGMDRETQTQIFDPFFTTKQVGKGTGLGLATVYGIVKQSGGYIWVYSELKKGTVFKIYLPRVERAEPPQIPAEPDRGAQKGTETILLAEDSEALREIATEYLASLGYTVIEAASGTEALCKSSTFTGKIDLLLTDVVMPETDGRKLADEIVQKRPGIKVLFSSGYTDDAIVRHGVLEPGVSFIQKPYRPRALARKIREVLDNGMENRGNTVRKPQMYVPGEMESASRGAVCPDSGTIEEQNSPNTVKNWVPRHR